MCSPSEESATHTFLPGPFRILFRRTGEHRIQSEFSVLLQIKSVLSSIQLSVCVCVCARATTIIMQNLQQLCFSYDHRILIFAFVNNWRQHFQSNSAIFVCIDGFLLLFVVVIICLSTTACHPNSDAFLFLCNKSLVTFKSLPHTKHNLCFSFLQRFFLCVDLFGHVCVCVCVLEWMCVSVVLCSLSIWKSRFLCILFCGTQIKSYLSFGSFLNMYLSNARNQATSIQKKHTTVRREKEIAQPSPLHTTPPKITISKAHNSIHQ